MRPPTAERWLCKPDWDDLLIVAFGSAPLPGALHAPLQQEAAAARAQNRSARILPVWTHPEQRKPPTPLADLLAIGCADPGGEDGGRLVRRVGALLSLWLRGQRLRVFRTLV